MKSQFGAVRIETARRWAVQELYLALSNNKNEFSSALELRNYNPEAGLYMDAAYLSLCIKQTETIATNQILHSYGIFQLQV